jgi:zinc protease
MRGILPLILFLILIPLTASAQTFGAQEATLENGLRIVVIPNHRAPVISHMIWYQVGGADEAPGVSGMAHYLEHLMFKGTETMAPGEYSKTIKSLGGQDNAFTSRDFTAYFASLSKDHLEKIMTMEADRMINIAPPTEHYISEKAVVLEERKQRTENDPRSQLFEQVDSALYANHPYSNPVIGWMHEIKRYEWPDVKAFYDLWYAPNNAIIVISGDITMEEVKPIAQKTFGSIPAKTLPNRERPEIPPAAGAIEIVLEHKQVQQPFFYTAYLAPIEAGNTKDSLALQVLAEIMDGGSATRLYRSLVAEQKKATSVFFEYSGTLRDYGTVSIGGTPAQGVDAKTLKSLLDTQIADVIQNGVTQDEVDSAIRRLQDAAIFARDSLMGPAMIFGSALTTGSSVNDIETWPQAIGTITPADVQAAAQKYLNPAAPWLRAPVTGYLLPAPDEASTPATPESKDSPDASG